MSKTLKVSSSTVTKTVKRYDEIGSHEDCHRKWRPRVTSAEEDTFIRDTSLRNCSQNKCCRVQLTDTSHHQLFRGDCVNQAFMVELLQRPLLKDTNKKNRLAWSKKHEQSTLDCWKSVLWSDESKFEILVPTKIGEMQSRWMDDRRMCGSQHEEWRRCDGVGMLCVWHCLWFI